MAHCGESVAGSFISSLVVTDVCSGWTEAIPLLAREQSLVVEGLEAISRLFPVPIRGIDSDNDSVFINETLLELLRRTDIEFTRSRAHRSNDQAWIEQKNGSVIRRFVGHIRYSGPIAGQALAHLYGAMRLYVNHFQPSFKLLDKSRNSGTVRKRYEKPATPCDRLLRRADDVGEEMKKRLRNSRVELDPSILAAHDTGSTIGARLDQELCPGECIHQRESGAVPRQAARPVETGRGSRDARVGRAKGEKASHVADAS